VKTTSGDWGIRHSLVQIGQISLVFIVDAASNCVTIVSMQNRVTTTSGDLGIRHSLVQIGPMQLACIFGKDPSFTNIPIRLRHLPSSFMFRSVAKYYMKNMKSNFTTMP
jgi:hypothetical protein